MPPVLPGEQSLADNVPGGLRSVFVNTTDRRLSDAGMCDVNCLIATGPVLGVWK